MRQFTGTSDLHVCNLRFSRIVAADVDVDGLQIPHTVLVLKLLLRLCQDNSSIARRIGHHSLHMVIETGLR